MKKIVLALALFAMSVGLYAEDSSDQFKARRNATLAGAAHTLLALEAGTGTVVRVVGVELSANANMEVELYSGYTEATASFPSTLSMSRLIDDSGTQVTATSTFYHSVVASGSAGGGTLIRKIYLGANKTESIDPQWFLSAGNKFRIDANGTGDIEVRVKAYERAP